MLTFIYGWTELPCQSSICFGFVPLTFPTANAMLFVSSLILMVLQLNLSCFLQAMKIVNTVKLKEEFDYESQCRKLENQIDNLTAEFERQLKLRDSKKYELERQLTECQHSFAEAEENLITRSEVVVYPRNHLWFGWWDSGLKMRVVWFYSSQIWVSWHINS